MTRLEQARLEMAEENKQDKEAVVAMLNNIFKEWELDDSRYKDVTIKGILRGKRSAKHYVVVNSNLLEIKNDTLIYTYNLNGSSATNTKNIMYIDGLNNNNDYTSKITNLIISH